jgi:hypothetical protein
MNFRRMVADGAVGGLVSRLALIFIGLVMGSGCIPGSVSEDSPDGGRTSMVTTGLACSQTPSGCLCADREALPNDLNACSRTSVATHSGEQGVCCANDQLCGCEAFACKNVADLAFCQCGPSISFPATVVGSASDACPSAPGQKCCLTPDTRVCVCSTADCDGAAMMVSSCTVATIAVCQTQQRSTMSCK